MEQYQRHLQALKENANYRQLPGENTAALIDLCSNDYLGINENTSLQERFFNEGGANYALSSCSSRLLGKQLQQHVEFEQELANAYHQEASLLYNSGYHVNVGVLSALAGANDLIVADKLIHASVIDGAKLSKADFMRYKHLDYQHLEQMLKKYRDDYQRVFIISESIFSMDGDVADLSELIALKERYNCLLYIDEAHALGVRGNKG